VLHVKKSKKVFVEPMWVLMPEEVGTIFLTCDPGILVRTNRSITTARTAKREGFHGYELMVAGDHRIHIRSLLQLAHFEVRDRNQKISYIPFKFPS
jgi:hypothetical protein